MVRDDGTAWVYLCTVRFDSMISWEENVCSAASTGSSKYSYRWEVRVARLYHTGGRSHTSLWP
jgi:hypothetical protein